MLFSVLCYQTITGGLVLKTMKWLTGSAMAMLLSIPAAWALDVGEQVTVSCPLDDCNATLALSYLGEFSLPWDYKHDGMTFGGISGLDYDPSTGHYFALSDDRAQFGPVRFYEIALDVSSDGIEDVSILRTVALKNENGKPFSKRAVDPESIRVGSDGNLYWTTEGSRHAGQPTLVRVSDRNGNFIRDFEQPDDFEPTRDKSSGIRENQALEGLTFLPSGNMIAAMETALYQDGGVATLAHGSLARFIRYDTASGEPTAEYTYPVSAIPQRPLISPFQNDNGVSEVLALDEHRLLVVERSVASGFGFTIKVFLADTNGATDVSEVEALRKAGDAVVPMRKQVAIDFRALGLTPDNIECVSFGKDEDGNEILIFASDDNFSADQKTQFYAFKIDQRPH